MEGVFYAAGSFLPALSIRADEQNQVGTEQVQRRDRPALSFEDEIRSVGSRLSFPLIGVSDQGELLIACLRHDGTRAVAIAHTDAGRIDCDACGTLGLALLGKQGHLRGGVVRQRAALLVVRGKQRFSRLATQDDGQLPGQVVCLGDAGIAAQATAGRLAASSITDQEDPALLEAISDERDRIIAQYSFELYGQVRDANGCPNELE